MVRTGNKSITGRRTELLPIGCALRVGDRAQETVRVAGQAQSCPVAVGGAVDADQRDHYAAARRIGDAPEVTLHCDAVVSERIAEGKVGAAGAICAQRLLD